MVSKYKNERKIRFLIAFYQKNVLKLMFLYKRFVSFLKFY